MQVLWDVQSGTAICGSPAHTDFTMTVKFFNKCNDRVLTAGNYNLKVWEYDRPNNKLRPTEATLGNLRRQFRSVCIDSDDQYAYCGTTTGDVLQIALDRVLFKNSGPSKAPVQLGVTATCEVPTGDVLVGGGDGSLQILRTVAEPLASNPKMLRKMGAIASTSVEGGITSISLAEMHSRAIIFYVGTAACNMYKVVYEPAGGK